jgi:hypothetical protein
MRIYGEEECLGHQDGSNLQFLVKFAIVYKFGMLTSTVTPVDVMEEVKLPGTED